MKKLFFVLCMSLTFCIGCGGGPESNVTVDFSIEDSSKVILKVASIGNDIRIVETSDSWPSPKRTGRQAQDLGKLKAEYSYTDSAYRKLDPYTKDERHCEYGVYVMVDGVVVKDFYVPVLPNSGSLEKVHFREI